MINESCCSCAIMRSVLGYGSLRDKEQGVGAVSWKKFFVIKSGKTNNAHQDVVEKFQYVGQTEVMSPEESDFLLVFCPIASRVGTDISEALEEITVNKPIILVVMHHTFNAEKTVAGSRRLVTDQRVYLTVDYLFYQSDLLSCERNHVAWLEIRNILGLPSSQASNCCKHTCHRKKEGIIGVFAVVLLILVVLVMLIPIKELHQ